MQLRHWCFQIKLITGLLRTPTPLENENANARRPDNILNECVSIKTKTLSLYCAHSEQRKYDPLWPLTFLIVFVNYGDECRTL